MARADLPARIARRAARAGLSAGPGLVQPLAEYLELLARWNEKINLTGLHVDPPDDEAIDRLVVEPVAAARFLASGDRVVLDVGSGGGSPALPLKLSASSIGLVMVESKVRKAAFLREASRQLGLTDVSVENSRLEDLPPRAGRVDVVTLRAVRMDRALMAALARWLKAGGRVFFFGSAAPGSRVVGGAVETHELVPERGSRLFVFRPGDRDLAGGTG